MFRKIQKRVFFSSCKVVGSSCLLILIGFRLIPIVSAPRYNSYTNNSFPSAAFAVIPTPGRNIYPGSRTNSASYTPTHQISTRSSFLSFASLNTDPNLSQTVSFEEEMEVLSKIVFANKKKSILKRFAESTCFKNIATSNSSSLENKPSTASTDIPPTQAFFPLQSALLREKN